MKTRHFQNRSSSPFKRGHQTLAFAAALLTVGSTGCEGELFEFVQEILKDSHTSKEGCSTTGTDSSIGSSNASTDADPTSSAEESSQVSTEDSTATDTSCVSGEVRPCETCSSGQERCTNGNWYDNIGCGNHCVRPGHVYHMQYNAKFDCGATMVPYRCDQRCVSAQSEDLPTVYVSRCKPTDCCGLAPGSRAACMDPEDIPDGGNCQSGPPKPEEIGKTWMTWEDWKVYKASFNR